MQSCGVCGKTVIKDGSAKVLVGCPHFPVLRGSFDGLPDEIKSVFGDLVNGPKK